MPEQIALTQTQEGVLVTLEQRRQELQALYAEVTRAMHAIAAQYAREAGLEGEGEYHLALNPGQSVVRLVLPDKEEEHGDQ